MQTINLTTSDKVKIIGNHFSVPLPSAGISLFHMLPATKESYDAFAEKLNSNGIGALAIDLRGHGESQGGPDDFINFTEKQHQSSIHDVVAAVDYQEKESHSPLLVCGASIGANLALQAIAEDDRVKKAILLSAGLNYRGVETLPLAKKVPVNKEIYVVAARDDGTCAEQGQKIFDNLRCKKKIKIFDVGGHGTDIFSAHPYLVDELIEWLNG